MLSVPHSLSRAQLPNSKCPASTPTWEVPALKAVARQYLSLEVLSEAQQHCGSALLETPNAMLTFSQLRTDHFPNWKRPVTAPTWKVPALNATT